MNHDPYDLNKQQAEQEEKSLRERLARETEAADLNWLMSSKRGRRIIWRLLEQSGVFRSTFHPTAMQMAFNEGYRNFGNRTLSMIHALCSGQYSVMIKENTDGGPTSEQRSTDERQTNRR